MTDTTRVERIEARAKGLGLHTCYHETTEILYMTHPKRGEYYFNTDDDKHLDAAEALLLLWEPGPVVEVGGDTTCALLRSCIFYDHMYVDDTKPPPKGKYKLVKVEDE